MRVRFHSVGNVIAVYVPTREGIFVHLVRSLRRFLRNVKRTALTYDEFLVKRTIVVQEFYHVRRFHIEGFAVCKLLSACRFYGIKHVYGILREVRACVHLIHQAIIGSKVIHLNGIRIRTKPRRICRTVEYVIGIARAVLARVYDSLRQYVRQATSYVAENVAHIRFLEDFTANVYARVINSFRERVIRIRKQGIIKVSIRLQDIRNTAVRPVVAVFLVNLRLVYVDNLLFGKPIVVVTNAINEGNGIVKFVRSNQEMQGYVVVLRNIKHLLFVHLYTETNTAVLADLEGCAVLHLKHFTALRVHSRRLRKADGKSSQGSKGSS